MFRAIAIVVASFTVLTVGTTHHVPTPTSTITTPRPAYTPPPDRIEPLGDSITAGFRSSDGNGYRNYLLAQLPVGSWLTGTQRDGTMADNFDEGHSGYQITDLQPLVVTWLMTDQPGTVLLDAGTNDAKNGAAGTTMVSNMKTMLDTIAGWSATVRVVVATLCISTALPASAQQAEADFNASLPALVATYGNHYTVADMTVLGAADLADGIHPNDGGYQKMASQYRKALSIWF